jgi:hypothetical protein
VILVQKIKAFVKQIALKRKYTNELSPSSMPNYNGRSYTRKRSLTLGRMLMIILRCSPFALQIRLDDFFEEIGHKAGRNAKSALLLAQATREAVVSKQAFSKARTNLDPEVVRGSYELTVQTMLECDDLELYKGRYRLCAIDCSDIALDNASELLEHFGGSGKNKDCAMATASLCYDPLNNIIMDGGLYPYGTCERDAARNHFVAMDAFPSQKGIDNLYINDRGYPSKELFAEMIDSGRFFLMRVRRKFNRDFDLVSKKEKVDFFHKSTLGNHLLPVT